MRVAAVDGDVIDANLLIAGAVKHDLPDFRGNISPWGVGWYAVMEKDRSHDLRVVIARFERSDAPLVKGQRRVGHNQIRVDLFPTADAQTIRASTIRGVEREIPRLQFVHGIAMLRTSQGQREKMLVFGKAACGPRGHAAVLRIGAVKLRLPTTTV